MASDETPLYGPMTMRTELLSERDERERSQERKAKLLALGARGYRTLGEPHRVSHPCHSKGAFAFLLQRGFKAHTGFEPVPPP